MEIPDDDRVGRQIVESLSEYKSSVRYISTMLTLMLIVQVVDLLRG